MELSVAFDDSYSSAKLTYRFTNPNAFSAAKIEVWDRPKMLFRAQVPVKARGETLWKSKEGTPDTPFALSIAVDDPNFPNNANASLVVVGTVGPVEGGPVPGLVHQDLVLEEGAAWPNVMLKGRNFGKHNTLILLEEQEGSQVWIAREYFPATLTDLEHVSVQIPTGYLLKPTVLQLEAVRVGDDSMWPAGSQGLDSHWSATVYVMAKDRPILSSIEPSAVVVNDQAEVPLRLLGSGFTANSDVGTNLLGGIGNQTYKLKTVFVSSNELRVAIPPDLLRSASSPITEDFRFWVRNGDDLHISDAQRLLLLPTPEFPLAGAKSPSISSISPYPVPLSSQQSSTDILLRIYGENFKNGDTVTAENGEPNGNARLRTELISAQQINALLPTEIWRHHQLSFRLSAQTSTRNCEVEAWEEQ
jgi:hypothetical protein